MEQKKKIGVEESAERGAGWAVVVGVE